MKQEQKITFVKPKHFDPNKHAIIEISVEKFDKEWSKSVFYADKSNKSLINPNKLEYYKNKIEKYKNIEVEMPEAKIGSENGKKIVGIFDGKHRYILCREMKYSFIPVMIPKNQENEFVKRFG